MRARHAWAWGWADKFPDDTARKGLAQMTGALLGAPPDPPPPAGPREVAPSRAPAPPPSLAAIVSTDDDDRAAHTYGKGYPDLVRGSRGDYRAAPDAIARPRDEADVVALLDWCASARLAAVPYGGGTSVVGGVECPRDRAAAIVTIDLGALDRVLEVDAVSRAARIQAGVRGPALDEQLGAHGLTLRHFPQSYEHSTLGGWLATRAGGHYATVYTHIDDLCESMRVITPRGAIATRRLPASGAGPAPDRLFLGSEGALGLITEAWMRVVPRPQHRASASVKFRRFADAVAATRAVAQSGLHPSNCRLLDATEAMLHRVAFDGTAVLLLGFESADHPLGPWLARALEIARDAGGELATGPTERSFARAGAGTGGDADGSAGSERSHDGEAGAWRAAFFDAPYLQSALVSIGVLADTFETACTWDRFDALHAAIADAAARAGAARLACRFTHVYPDGPAPYYTFLARARPGDELAQWRTIKEAVSEVLASHGATITHHHAVGRVHRPWYDRERPALFGEALAAVKRTLDPDGLLNPGVLV